MDASSIARFVRSYYLPPIREECLAPESESTTKTWGNACDETLIFVVLNFDARPLLARRLRIRVREACMDTNRIAKATCWLFPDYHWCAILQHETISVTITG